MTSSGISGQVPAGSDDNSAARNDEAASRLKRTACVLCRKRKLKCDAARPKCSTCHRLGHECEYNEVRKKSGPKRGYVKALEARLASVETQLKTSNDGTTLSQPTAAAAGPSIASNNTSMQDSAYQSTSNVQMFPNDNGTTTPEFDFGACTSNMSEGNQVPFDESFSWDMITLGLEEPLPSAEVMNELYELYFNKIHPSIPMIHRGRFLSALNLGPQAGPPITLRYAMWTLAAAISDQYTDMANHFYQRARKYAQLDEMRGFGEGIISVQYCQTWILLAIYEFKHMHFPRAWLSTGRAVRLAMMMGLHRQDGQGLEVKQCLLPAKDWTEREERRRTFWMSFWADRCASIGTGWPMSIDEQDIMTNLPASEEAFQSGRMEKTPTLGDIVNAKTTEFSNFGGAIVLSALFGRNLHHLHRPTADDREDDLNGGFWERHRKIDAVLLNINMNLPDSQRIPLGLPDPNVIFMNMCIQTSIICLHQAAIFKIDKNNLPSNLGQDSKIRCVTAAAEIATLMRAVSHCELAVLNPFTAFCLYVASRVFVQYLKSRPHDQSVMGSLNFMLSAMHAMKRRNPLNESFLAQLEVDLVGANIKTNHQSATESLIKKGIYPYFDPNKDKRCDQGIAHANGDISCIPEPTTIIPTNMQENIGSSSNSEITLPMGNPSPSPAERLRKTSHIPDSSIGILNEINSRIHSVGCEDMDLSPGHSGNGSTPSMYTQRSASSGNTAYTPPDASGSDGSMYGMQQSQAKINKSQQQQQQNMPLWENIVNGGTGNMQSQNTNFYHYNMNDGPGLTPQHPSISAPSPMNQQEFENLTKQFFPASPNGGDIDGWIGTGSTGMTPGAGGSDEWNQILDSMTWDNNVHRPAEAWALGRGA